eukprot:6193175-Pleurochrysis_carterae.AAC.1
MLSNSIVPVQVGYKMTQRYQIREGGGIFLHSLLLVAACLAGALALARGCGAAVRVLLRVRMVHREAVVCVYGTARAVTVCRLVQWENAYVVGIGGACDATEADELLTHRALLLPPHLPSLDCQDGRKDMHLCDAARHRCAAGGGIQLLQAVRMRVRRARRGAGRCCRRDAHGQRRVVEGVGKAVERSEAQEGLDLVELRGRHKVLAEDVRVHHHHAETGHVKACVEVGGDEPLLEGQDPLAPAVVRVDLRLRLRPVNEDLRAGARGAALAGIA